MGNVNDLHSPSFQLDVVALVVSDFAQVERSIQEDPVAGEGQGGAQTMVESGLPGVRPLQRDIPSKNAGLRRGSDAE